MVSSICLWYLLALATPQAPAVIQVDEPALVVGGVEYSTKDLLGCTNAQLRDEFDRDAATWTRSELTAYLSEHAPAIGAKARDMTDEQLRLAVWEEGKRRLWYTVCSTVREAAAVDCMAAELGLRLEDHYDLAVLRDGLSRYAAYTRRLDSAQRDGQPFDSALLSELRRDFGFTLDDASWRDLSRFLAMRRPVIHRRWLSSREGAGVVDELKLKGMLARSILAEAITTGVYARQAREQYARTRWSLLSELSVDRWEGSPAALSALIAAAVDADGRWKPDARETLRHTLAGLCHARTGSHGLRPDVVAVVDGLAAPLNELAKVGPSSYRWTAEASLSELQASRAIPEGYNPQSDALRLAARRWVPEIQVKVPALAGMDASLLQQLSGQTAQGCMTEVRLGKFERKPVPGSLFDEYEAGLPRFQDAAARLTAARLAGSAEQLAAAKAQIETLAKEAEPVWRRHYEALLKQGK